MSDGQQFLLILTLFYLSDCLRWAPLHAAGFLSFFLRGWTLRRPSELFGTTRWGLLMAFPLPPLGHLFLAQPWPVALTGKGVSSPTLDQPNPGSRIPRPVRFLAWEGIASVSSERRSLLLNGNPIARLSSPQQACFLADLVESLRNRPHPERDLLISQALQRSLHAATARRRVTIYRKATRPLRCSQNLLFAMLYGGIPLSYICWGGTMPFFLVLAASWILMWQIALEFRRLHLRWYPGERSELWQHLLAQVLFPPTTLRAHDELSAGYLAKFHPLAVSCALLGPEEFQRKADAIRRDAHFAMPLPDGIPEIVRTNALSFHQDHLLPALFAFFQRHPTSLPMPAGWHCPRCLVEYEPGATGCADCEGLGLVPPERR